MTGTAVAVTGMACRFPGAPDTAAFWDLLREGREGLTRFTDTDLAARGVPRRLRHDPAYVPVGGFIDGQDLFDPAPFGLTDAEAALMDPQQRLFLECSWHALESAGHGGGRDAGSVGVFAGAAHSSYLASNLAGRWDPTGGGADPVGSLQTAISTQADYLPLQVAYRLDLTGPAIAVNTTCSTSLVAVHTAVQSLLGEECDTALAGGVSLTVPQGLGYRYVPDGIFSVDGRVRPFSAEGTGIVYTQGAGVVVLRRLTDALADGDPILAVVHGSAVNNDGADKAGFTAPSLRGQARVIAEALAVAGLDPRQVGHVEAHGTATPLGDPIETGALLRVFGARGPAWCGLGSVKSNIGHANSAAGAASFIKTVLALQHQVLPASLHAEPRNELLQLAGSPFDVVTATRAWDGPAYAGVSSFGIGGTNCHVLLGPAPRRDPTPADERPQILLATGHDPAAAQQSTEALDASQGLPAADLAYTLQQGRRHGPYRVVTVTDGTTSGGAARWFTPVRVAAIPPRVVFAFPGAGSQYAGMGARLYAQEPVFAGCMDECAGLLTPLLGADIRDALRGDTPATRMRDAAFGLPALFAVSLATARLLESWGITPGVVLGHSLGEYAAAVTAGALTLPEAARLVAVRCTEVSRVAGDGAMLAVPLTQPQLRQLLAAHPDVDLAVVNAPDACVVSGPRGAIAALDEQLRRDGYEPTRLHVDAALHSRLVEPAMPALRAAAAGLTRRGLRIPMVSTVTGEHVGDELGEAAYWIRQLRDTVHFSEALRTATDRADASILVQVGPGGALAGIARRHGIDGLRAALVTLPADKPGTDAHTIRQAVAALWTHGVPVDFPAMHRPGRQRVTAPGYAFQRRRLWIDPPPPVATSRDDIHAGEPLQVPGWQQLPPGDRPTRIDGTWGVAAATGDDPLSAAVIDALVSAGSHAVPLTPEAACDAVIVLPGPAGTTVEAVTDAVLRQATLARLIAAQPRPPRLLLQVTRAAVRVIAADRPDPAGAATRTLTRILGQEQPGLRWRNLDLDHDPTGDLPAVLAEAHALTGDPTGSGTEVAVRGGLRWRRTLMAWQPADRPAPTPSDGAFALVTGGLGDVGITIAEHLARRGLRVVLTSRTGPPDATGGGAAADRARALARLRQQGLTVEVRALDAADTAGTTRLLAELSTTAPLAVVVHAAGVIATAGLHLLREAQSEHIEGHLRSKLSGAMALRDAIGRLPREQRPGAVVLMSSAATLVGGIGTGPYAAANAVMDALAEQQDGDSRWISAVWDGWRVGPAGQERTVALSYTLDAAAGMRALDRLLAAGAAPPVVAVSPRDLNAAMAATVTAAAPLDPTDEQALAGLSPTQRVIAELWSTLFATPVASADADFFALGGHSLLATRMLVALRERFGVDLRLRDLLQHSTVAALATLLADTPTEPQPVLGSGIPASAVVAEDGTFPMTRVQHAYWIGRGGGYRWGNIPCYFYLEHDCPDLDISRYERAWQQVIDRHPMLRAVATGQGRLRILDELPPYRVRVHDLTSADEQTRTQRLATLRERISTRPGPSDRWPMFQVQAVRLPDSMVRLLIGVDVLICDAASWWVIDRELRHFYHHPDTPLPAPAIDFASCVADLQQRRSGPAGQRAATYWRSRLPTLPGAPALPTTDTAGPARFVRRSARLDAPQWTALQRHAAQRRLTPTAVLLAAYADTLAAWSGSERFTIMLTMFDRPAADPGVHTVVGDFTSLVLHEVDRGQPDTFAAHANATQHRLFADLDHREFSALDVLGEQSARSGEIAAVPVVFTSALGMADLLGTTHDLEWAGRQVYAVSQTPQTLLDHQVLEQDGELRLQWDALEPVLDPADLDRAFTDYVTRVRRLTGDPHAWDEPDPDDAADTTRHTVAGPAPRALPDIALPVRAGSGPQTLFLMHPSGGDILCYAELSRLLDERVDIVAVTDPGLVGEGSRSVPTRPGKTGTVEADPPDDITEMARLYLDVVRAHQPDGPYLLGGWSMGGSVAQEMARQAHAAGQDVPLLVMVDSNDPTYITAPTLPSSALVEAEMILRHLRALEAFLGVDLGAGSDDARQRLADLPTGQRWAYAEQRLREHRLLGRAEDVRDRLGVFDRHLRALAAHTPRRLDAPGTTTLLIRADQPAPRNSGVGMGVDDTPHGLADLGWSRHLTGPLRVAGVDAHHYSVLRRPAVGQVAQLINETLDPILLATAPALR
jgi:acyl transferase domain-containing protein/thioesterase domain-containing protein/NAD(P)-dependent dehydrogenase (short-subunit alcohol dehydrogenase family)/acyl carrier protein